MSVLDDKVIEALRDGKMELHCLSMTLAKKDGTRAYHGPGFIRQDENQQLVFTLYDSGYADAVKDFTQDISHSGIRAGQFYPRDQYYTLTATDQWKRIWHSAETLGVRTDPAVEKGTVVTGSFREITCEDDVTEDWERHRQTTPEAGAHRWPKAYYTYYLFGSVGDFPCNAAIDKETKVAGKQRKFSGNHCVASVDTTDYHVELLNDNAMVIFSVHSKIPVESRPENADLRFIEALQFVLGRPFLWQVLQVSHRNTETTIIRSKDRRTGRRLFPPLELRTSLYFDDVWTLFDKYLGFVFPFNEHLWHPVSSRLFTLHHVQEGLWNTRMLTAGVEVEGLIREQFPDIAAAPDAITRSVDAILDFMRRDRAEPFPAMDEASQQKIGSVLGRLKTPFSAGNKLRSLASAGVVRTEDVDAWEKVRHPSAHALRGELAMTDENSQRLDRVIVLFYHLVFHLIGYKGKYSDYGECGHEVKTYPS